MDGKFLGKIESAEYGMYPDYEYLVGLQLTFSLQNFKVSDGGKYTFNSLYGPYKVDDEREKVITDNINHLIHVLEDAKVRHVSELVGKPVEVTIERNCFKDFRILTEVL